MTRQKRESHPVTIRMEQEIFDKLTMFVNDSGQSKTVAIERALEMYIDDYYSKQEIIRNAVVSSFRGAEKKNKK